MSNFKVTEPILNSPFEEPREYWWIVEGETPPRRSGRRFAHYFYRDPRAPLDPARGGDVGTMIELKLVTRVRERLVAWRAQGYPGASRTTVELLRYWGPDVRCIVSVGMLTEGWDCDTVTHIAGLRPFMSQLLCEQVLGRGPRRTRYELSDGGKFSEETAKIFGVPFQIIPFKANPSGPPLEPVKRVHVKTLPAKTRYAIRFPRVEGYTQAIRNRIAADWNTAPTVTIDPAKIPPEVEMARMLPTNDGRVWEQSAAYLIDSRDTVDSFVKNAGLGFAAPYFHNGERHDYLPDFIVRLAGDSERVLILETKGFDELESVKRGWVKAVNADGKYGLWSYAVAKRPTDVVGLLKMAAEAATELHV
jgi:hypothetical protein